LKNNKLQDIVKRMIIKEDLGSYFCGEML
jgi:hypothetical protein